MRHVNRGRQHHPKGGRRKGAPTHTRRRVSQHHPKKGGMQHHRKEGWESSTAEQKDGKEAAEGCTTEKGGGWKAAPLSGAEVGKQHHPNGKEDGSTTHKKGFQSCCTCFEVAQFAKNTPKNQNWQPHARRNLQLIAQRIPLFVD